MSVRLNKNEILLTTDNDITLAPGESYTWLEDLSKLFDDELLTPAEDWYTCCGISQKNTDQLYLTHFDDDYTDDSDALACACQCGIFTNAYLKHALIKHMPLIFEIRNMTNKTIEIKGNCMCVGKLIRVKGI